MRVKISVLGDSRSGKTCFTIRRIYGAFLEEDFPHDFFDFYGIHKLQRRPRLLPPSLNFLAKFNQKRISYSLFDDPWLVSCLGSHVLLLCFAVNDKDALRNLVTEHNEDIRRICETTPAILVGLKSDRREYWGPTPLIRIQQLDSNNSDSEFENTTRTSDSGEHPTSLSKTTCISTSKKKSQSKSKGESSEVEITGVKKKLEGTWTLLRRTKKKREGGTGNGNGGGGDSDVASRSNSVDKHRGHDVKTSGVFPIDVLLSDDDVKSTRVSSPPLPLAAPCSRQHPSTKTSSTTKHLPPELVSKILKYVDPPTLQKSRQLNSIWNTLAKEELDRRPEVSPKEAMEAARKMGCVLYMECSAKTGDNVDTVFEEAIREAYSFAKAQIRKRKKEEASAREGRRGRARENRCAIM
ncbi:hypothetical protein HK102_001849 [Quaeritorhiza haematococci]|nr:hypothetical protein HK102_001849 [Quaeritorhiza haematococci]